MSRKRSERAFTLIETLVAIAIVSILFSLGFVNFREFQRRQETVSVANRLKADLRLSQTSALAGEKPADSACDSPNTLTGYSFEVTGETTYQIAADCSGGGVVTKSVSLTQNVILGPPAINPILFRVLGQGTNLTGDVSITITNPTGEGIIISVSQSGKVD